MKHSALDKRLKLLCVVLTIALVTLSFAACGGGGGDAATDTPAQSAENESAPSDENAASDESATGDESGDKPRVALIVNQKFGDGASTDDMKDGLERAAADFGLDIKTFESVDIASHEDDIRAVAKDGFDLIFTTYPNMTEGTVNVANEFPDTKFAAIFQFINSEDVSVPNVYDMQFHGEQGMYIAGVIATMFSPTGKIGMITGMEEPSPNAESNAFMQGVAETDPNATVEFSFAGSYEDVAKGKEIATGMIGNGVDYLQTDAGTVQTGVMEAAKESTKGRVLVCGDTSNMSATYPEGTTSYMIISFGEAVYVTCKAYSEGTLETGKTGIMDMKNGTISFSKEVFEQFKGLNPDDTATVDEAVAKVDELTNAVMDGSLEIPFNTDTPEWSKIKAAVK
jgi:basic membrane protein A